MFVRPGSPSRGSPSRVASPPLPIPSVRRSSVAPVQGFPRNHPAVSTKAGTGPPDTDESDRWALAGLPDPQVGSVPVCRLSIVWVPLFLSGELRSRQGSLPSREKTGGPWGPTSVYLHPHPRGKRTLGTLLTRSVSCRGRDRCGRAGEVGSVVSDLVVPSGCGKSFTSPRD